jgi:hypothetical protein
MKKTKNCVSIEQLIEHLTTSKKLGRTLPDLARHFGTTKDRIKRTLAKIPGEWRSVSVSDGTVVYALKKYKKHQVRRVYQKYSGVSINT